MLSPAPAKIITASFIAEIEMGCFRVGLINVMIVCKVARFMAFSVTCCQSYRTFKILYNQQRLITLTGDNRDCVWHSKSMHSQNNLALVGSLISLCGQISILHLNHSFHSFILIMPQGYRILPTIRVAM